MKTITLELWSREADGAPLFHARTELGADALEWTGNEWRLSKEFQFELKEPTLVRQAYIEAFVDGIFWQRMPITFPNQEVANYCPECTLIKAFSR